MRSILLSITALGLAAAAGLPLTHRHHSTLTSIGPDTLTSGVHAYPGNEGQVLNGATHDLYLLDMHSISITRDRGYGSYGHSDSADDLLIVKEGHLIIDSQGRRDYPDALRSCADVYQRTTLSCGRRRPRLPGLRQPPCFGKYRHGTLRIFCPAVGAIRNCLILQRKPANEA